MNRKLGAWVLMILVFAGTILVFTSARPGRSRGFYLWFGGLCAWAVIRLALIYRYSSPSPRPKGR